ncbi:hypothetical protein KIN20_035645 [Parelaphostrongylus tenuis]|uniref:Uncharacterized protein n=1 Tax=Parelaphostrongylus tenuis TaxID=148309 RepID=A0AAD5RC35_PARTN|nr:hypothetical protein KIN20_035645 [Parelaphostrongylus tenuis]
MDKCFELLNSQSEYITFTHEKPKANWLLFLNVQINVSKTPTAQNGIENYATKHSGSLPICSFLAHKALKMANLAET